MQPFRLQQFERRDSSVRHATIGAVRSALQRYTDARFARSSTFVRIRWVVFEEPEDPTTRSFFSEIISSISDIKFSHSGRYMLTRDFLNLKIWDLQMDNKPVETYPIHEYLRTKLCVLYENDCIFDKFECCWSPRDE